MRCKCGERMKCVDTREMTDGTVHRRHHCPRPDCGEKVRTIEQAVVGEPGEYLARVNSLEMARIKQELVGLVSKAIQDFKPGESQ